MSLMGHVWMAPEAQGLSSNLLNVEGRIACAHVSGLLVRFDMTAGLDGIRGPGPHQLAGLEAQSLSQV